MKHVITLSEASQLVDNGVPKTSQAKSENGCKARGGKLDGTTPLVSSSEAPGKKDKNLLIGLYPPR